MSSTAPGDFVAGDPEEGDLMSANEPAVLPAAEYDALTDTLTDRARRRSLPPAERSTAPTTG